VEEVFRRPASLEVARFLGYSIVPGLLLARLLGEVSDWTWGLVPPRSVRVVGVGVDEDGPIAQGTVRAVQGALGRARILVDIGAPLAAELPASEIRALGLRPDSPVTLRIDPTHLAWL
jgi:hypothetical protein